MPESNQQVGREPNQFPANEKQQETIRNDQPEHRRREQREKTKEACEILVVGHVADAVNENQEPDQRHHHQHDCRERVKHPAELQPGFAHLKPVEIVNLTRRVAGRARDQRMSESAQRKQQGKQHRPNGPSVAANRRLGCFITAITAAAASGDAGISQRFWTIQAIYPLSESTSSRFTVL